MKIGRIEHAGINLKMNTGTNNQRNNNEKKDENKDETPKGSCTFLELFNKVVQEHLNKEKK